MASRPAAVLAATALLLGACSSGGGGDDGASLGETRPPTAVTAPELPATSAPGTGVVVVGSLPSTFSVTTCELEPSADGTMLTLTGAGTSSGGVPFQVEVRRFSSGTEGAETFTDTITYTNTARILQLQRIEVKGEVTDLRDPGARGTLIRVRPDGLSATGVAGPPGAVADDDDEGIVGMALDATC